MFPAKTSAAAGNQGDLTSNRHQLLSYEQNERTRASQTHAA